MLGSRGDVEAGGLPFLLVLVYIWSYTSSGRISRVKVGALPLPSSKELKLQITVPYCANFSAPEEDGRAHVSRLVYANKAVRIRLDIVHL